MKLIIQIPCYNEEKTLGVTLDALPRQIPGIDVVETLIVDDGSTDRTAEVAREHGVNHIVSFSRNRGLSKGFITGLNEALRQGADIIVNTDADNQYNADDIPKLIQPILDRKAEIVIGARPIKEIEHFSLAKKILQKLGSLVVRVVSRTSVSDAPSGFRAFSREAAMKINVFSEYTYTLETIIQSGQKGLSLVSVPIRVNEDLRPSRLVKSLGSYVFRSISTITRIFITYRPFRFFFYIALALFFVGFVLGARFLVLWLMGQGSGHIQSLILAAILLIVSFQVGLTGLLADIISVNRKLLEEIQYRQKESQFGRGGESERE